VGNWCICLPSTHTWCCSRSTPPPQRGTGRPSRLPAPRATPATPTPCWTCCYVIANSCAPCGRIPWQPVCCNFLVEERRQTVDEKTRANLRLTDCLKLYFPQVLRWFDDVTSPLVGDLLQRWPTLEQLQRVHRHVAQVFSRAQLPQRGKERGTHRGHPTSNLGHARRWGRRVC
jgi:hypothetical protein